jgi:hypothetical protein
MWHNLLGLKEVSERTSSRKECFVYEVISSSGRARKVRAIADCQTQYLVTQMQFACHVAGGKKYKHRV